VIAGNGDQYPEGNSVGDSRVVAATARLLGSSTAESVVIRPPDNCLAAGHQANPASKGPKDKDLA